MKIDDINTINQKFNELSNEKKKEYADNERHTMNFLGILLNIFCCIIAIVLYIGQPGITSMILCIFVLLFDIIFTVIIRKNNKKTDDELALRHLKKKAYVNDTATSKIDNQPNKIGANFSTTKEITINASSWSSTKLLIDDRNKKFIYQQGKNFSKIYNFTDINGYEVYENGNSKVQGRAGAALVGGAFFGLGGLIVGSSMSRKINEKCNQLKLFIRLNDLDCPQIIITYVDNVNWDKSGLIYRKMKENLQSVCSVLEFMINNKTLEQTELKQPETKSEQTKKEQLQELKEMLDEGLITQEDFELKKKQILGL